MDIQEFFQEIRSKYPVLTEATDKEHLRKFYDEDFDFFSLWLESFSMSLNAEMNNGVSAEEYIELFEYFSEKYEMGNKEIKSHIDVSFVENLFRKVSLEGITTYWGILPENLKILYVRFHGRDPVPRSGI